MRGLGLGCALVATILAATPAHAQGGAQGPKSAPTAGAPESVYTELLKGRCKFISYDKETNEDQVKRCPGHGGAQVLTLASHTTVYLSFQWSKSHKTEQIVSGWSLGDKVEWRGVRTPKGFAPYATIVRVIPKDPRTTLAGGHVLAVMRMEPRDACLAAAVDVGANKDANALAREAADTVARTFACGKDKPQAFGPASEWIDQVIGVDGPEPAEAPPAR